MTERGRESGPFVCLGGRVRKRGEEIDSVVIGVDDLGVALAPEGVPRLFLRSKARGDDSRVRRVDVAGRRALEGETHAVAFRLNPIGIELLDELERVPHERDTARQRDVEMVARGLRYVDAKEPVEADGLLHVLRDDADRR